MSLCHSHSTILNDSQKVPDVHEEDLDASEEDFNVPEDPVDEDITESIQNFEESEDPELNVLTKPILKVIFIADPAEDKIIKDIKSNKNKKIIRKRRK